MSKTQLVLTLMSLSLVMISGEEFFCEKDRKLLLGGVFSIDNIVLAYSWKDAVRQKFLVWRYGIKDNQLTPIGTEVNVKVFPGL